jgi:hypothetical protein
VQGSLQSFAAEAAFCKVSKTGSSLSVEQYSASDARLALIFFSSLGKKKIAPPTKIKIATNRILFLMGIYNTPPTIRFVFISPNLWRAIGVPRLSPTT